MTRRVRRSLTPRPKRVEVCGHAAYSERTAELLKSCICTSCGHFWFIALRPDAPERNG